MNQTRLTATAPTKTGRYVTAGVTVDTGQLVKATPVAWEGLAGLVGSVLRKKGGDPSRAEWSAEPIGPQVRLVAVNGSVL